MSELAAISVEVVYAEPDRAVCKAYRLSAPATVATALRVAAADSEFSGVDFAQVQAGVYGKAVTREHLLEEGDRIEIYRQLAADPKAARRARVERARRLAARGQQGGNDKP